MAARIIAGVTGIEPAVTFADAYESMEVPLRPSHGIYAPVDTSAIPTDNVTTDVRVTEVLDRLIAALSGVREVLAIIAEPVGTSGALHITVFAEPLLDEARARVYAAERGLLDSLPEMVFDFHLRRPERSGGKVVVPPASHDLVLWHRAGGSQWEDRCRASTT